ncbi:cell wall adhesin EAP1-like [Melanaphis sacchari]|uniref:cell wall adhesin EAP1-like n=1 Tax=Melanaphis sacchari TaxID=742174 RepID=UPI000DC1577A|nr:cell wall adhesin EAP1-like [Melanaphis sacchari]
MMSASAAGYQFITAVHGHQNIMHIFTMECLKMCVVIGLALTTPLGRPANAAPSPIGAYVYHQYKRSPADPNVDLTSALATNFGGFNPSATLPDFGYGSGFPSTSAGFGFDDVASGLLHLSHPYAATTFGSEFSPIGYPFSESTLNQLQFRTAIDPGSPSSFPVGIKYNPKVSNAGLNFYELSATESAKPNDQKAVQLQQTRPNEQQVPVKSLNSAPDSLASLQQSYPAATAFVPQKQLYTAAIPVPLQQSYPATVSVPQQQSYPSTASAPLPQSYPAFTSVPQQQSYSASVPAPLQQSYSTIASAPLQQSYPATISNSQQQSYPTSISAPLQQSHPASTSVFQQQSYPNAISAPLQQSYVAAISKPPQQPYPTTAEDFRISAYQQQQQQQQQPTTSSSAGPPNTSNVGSVPDLALELRPPPYTAPPSSVDYRQNANILSPSAPSYPSADINKNNNNYPVNDFGLSSAPTAGTSGQNQVFSGSNGGQLPGNTNDFRAAGSNAKPDQTHTNVYYTAASVPVSGTSNSVSSDVPNYYSVPSISYSSTAGEFAGSTNAPPAAQIQSIGTDRGVSAVNPTGGQNPPNSIPSVTYTNSNSISANSYSDSNLIQSSSYTTPGTPIAVNPYNDYKLGTENFYGDSNSISLNSKRESFTVDSSYKHPSRIQYSSDAGSYKTIQ